MIQQKTMKNDKFEKNIIPLNNSSSDSKADFYEKIKVWYLEVNIECVAYSITYLTYNRHDSIYKIVYFISRVLNRAL